jgi:hypothetical protein
VLNDGELSEGVRLAPLLKGLGDDNPLGLDSADPVPVDGIDGFDGRPMALAELDNPEEGLDESGAELGGRDVLVPNDDVPTEELPGDEPLRLVIVDEPTLVPPTLDGSDVLDGLLKDGPLIPDASAVGSHGLCGDLAGGGVVGTVGPVCDAAVGCPVGFVGSGGEGFVCICAASAAEAHRRVTQPKNAVFITLSFFVHSSLVHDQKCKPAASVGGFVSAIPVQVPGIRNVAAQTQTPVFCRFRCRLRLTVRRGDGSGPSSRATRGRSRSRLPGRRGSREHEPVS